MGVAAGVGGGSSFGSIPGDPGAVREAASRIATLVAAMGDSGSSLSSAASGLVGSSWTGDAASHFQSFSSRLTGALHDTDSGLGTVPGALNQFATVLETCQANLSQANTMMSQASEDYSSSLASLGSIYPAHQVASDPAVAQQCQAATNSIDSAYSSQVSQASSLANSALSQHQEAVSALQGRLGQSSDAGRSLLSLLTDIGDGLGAPVAALSGLATVFMLRATARFATVGSAFERSFDEEASALVGTLARALVDGTAGPEEALTRITSLARSADTAENLFTNAARSDLASGGVESLFGRYAPMAGRVAGGLGIMGDMFTIWHPDEGGAWGNAERGVAAANAVGTGGLMASDMLGLTAEGGVLAADATLGWVPVAGQVLVVGTGLFLAGDYMYTHVKWFKDGVDGIGDGISDGVSAIGHGASDVAHWFGL